jgi:predicted DNA-binding transcriptional regulator AlpA
MQPTAKIFPIDFPIDRNMSSSTKLYQNVHQLLQKRLRPLFKSAQLKYMNTHTNDSMSTTVDIQGLRSIFSLGRTAMHNLTKDPSFPQAYVISARHHLWDRDEAQQWLESRKVAKPKVRKIRVIAPKDQIIDGIVFAKRVA